jgi:hypothetical protein
LASNGGQYGVEEDVAVKPTEGSGYAFVDPMVIIDPIWLADHPGFTIDFSPNVISVSTPTSDVPEPSTLAIFLLGIGTIGRTLRARRSPNTATA